MSYDLRKVRLTDEQWDRVYSLLMDIGLTYDDCISNTVCQVILANRIREVTGKEVEQLLREQEDK